MKKKSLKSKKKKIITPEEKERRAHIKEIRTIFSNAGFNRIPELNDKEFKFKERKSDFDDIYIYENIIILTEYTSSQTKDISDHLLKKKVIFDHILDNSDEFLNMMVSNFPPFKKSKSDLYDNEHFFIKILYCSKNEINPEHKTQVPRIKYFDYHIVKYFTSLTNNIKISSRYELLRFLNLTIKDIGENCLKTTSNDYTTDGTILPEAHSNFDPGFKVISFYIDAAFLLQSSYVLRKDSWMDDNEGLYQRMILPAKIKAIRKYLHNKRRVFINNIVVTLPSATKILDNNGNTVDPSTLKKTSPVKILIPNGFDTIGIIDGQHRVFAYHEGGEYENEIKKLRIKQNLLVTGIVYPELYTESKKIGFEANLFLEINSNQANAKSNLKQSINLILNPFASESIAKAVIYKINRQGPLSNRFERYYYEKNKIKTTSIVSYALQPIVKLSGNDSFFYVWENSRKNELLNHENTELLNEYLDYCTSELNKFFFAVLNKINKSRWQIATKDNNAILSTTTINGLIICLRKIIQAGKFGDQLYYETQLDKIDKFDFRKYKSSQYADMANSIYQNYFIDQ